MLGKSQEVSTNRSRLRACSALLGRDRLTLLKLSRKLTGIREVPGMMGSFYGSGSGEALDAYGVVWTSDGDIGRCQWQNKYRQE